MLVSQDHFIEMNKDNSNDLICFLYGSKELPESNDIDGAKRVVDKAIEQAEFDDIKE